MRAMVAKAQKSERMPSQPSTDSVASSEVSLYRNVLKIKQDHDLEDLGISFYDAETTIQWSYNADHYFHAASTMKLAVLLGVFRQVDRGELQLDAPVHVRNRFTSIVNQEPFMLDLGRDADPDVYGHLGKTLTVRELAYWMITKSSNLATNLLVDVVGIPTIQLALDELEIDGVRVLRGVEDSARVRRGPQQRSHRERPAQAAAPHRRRQGLFAESVRRDAGDHARSAVPQRHPGRPAESRPRRAQDRQHLDRASRRRHRVSRRAEAVRARDPHAVPGREQGRGTAVADVSRDIFNTLAGSVYE